MNRRLLLVLSVLGGLVSASETTTVVDDPPTAKLLRGKHLFGLQWIEGRYGVAKVDEANGRYLLDAHQQDRKGNFARVTGTVTRIARDSFELDGTVTTRVSFNNGGKTCERPGHFTFRITSGRRYWRLKEMDNCEGNAVVDYVDIYFDRPR